MTLACVALTLALLPTQGPSAAKPSRPYARLFQLPTVIEVAVPPVRSPSRPFERLFQPPTVIKAAGRPAWSPEVVCGTIFVRPDASQVSRMPRLTPSEDRRFTMRVEQPSNCTAARRPPR